MRYALGGLAGMVAGLAIAWVLWGSRVPVEVCVDVARQVVATSALQRPPAPRPGPPIAGQPVTASPAVAVAPAPTAAPVAAAIPAAAAPHAGAAPDAVRPAVTAAPRVAPPAPARARTAADDDKPLAISFFPEDPGAREAFAAMDRSHASPTMRAEQEAARAVADLSGQRRSRNEGFYTFLNVLIVSSPFVLLILLILVGDDWLRLRQSFSQTRRKKSLKRILIIGIPLGLVAFSGIAIFLLHLLGLIR